MSYARLSELKMDLGIAADTTTDDVLLQAYLDEATEYIDGHTGTTFEAETETRYYEADCIDGAYLYLDRWLLTVTTLTNGDSDSTVIASTEYWLWPRNDSPPYYAIRLEANSDDSWEIDTDYMTSVAGTWGYSSTPPRDIVRACKRLAMYYYAQKDSQVFDVTAVPEAGIIQVPQGIPRDVKRILDRYQAKVPRSFAR